MNAKLLEHVVRYRETHRLDVPKIILSQKILYQYKTIQKKEIGKRYREKIKGVTSIKELFLIEARAAKEYWNIIHKEYLHERVEWNGRKAHTKDPFNTLLDIGYHYLTERIVKACIKLDIPTEIGFFHNAQSKHAHPFAYDFMEWLRPIVVDQIVLKIIRKKKKYFKEVDQKDIGYLIYSIKKEFDTYYFHRKLGYCITLEYWIEIILLHFVYCVYTKKMFEADFPSLRHENRCKKNRPIKDGSVYLSSND